MHVPTSVIRAETVLASLTTSVKNAEKGFFKNFQKFSKNIKPI
jgi:hypothetical protein